MLHSIRNVMVAGLLSLGLSGCSGFLPEGLTFDIPYFASAAPADPPPVQDPGRMSLEEALTQAPTIAPIAYTSPIQRFGSNEKQCLMRAMYFESNRSSEEGMLAVGTVVMNRVSSPKFDNSICSVVGAPNQFAPGVLSRPMTEARPLALAGSVADRILRGERHAGVQTAKFFHTQGLSFPYNNMHYVLNAGGNSFYIKTSRR